MQQGVDDVSALSWVQDEVRRSLENAHKALRRHLKESESILGSDVDTVDPSVLQGARAQLHQAGGALALVGMVVPAQLLRASEAAVQRMIERPARATTQAVDVIEHASFALLDYMARLVAGKAVAGVALFPQYRAVQELAGADRVHPADLWGREWRWRELPAEAGVEPRPVDASVRNSMEPLMLRLMRSPDRTTLRRMSDLCASLGAGSQGRPATLWRLAAALFQAQAAGLLRGDVFVKRAAPRLLAQARASANAADVSERLAQDLLFFCARAAAPSAEHPAPRLDAVRQAWALDSAEALPDYDASPLGRYDPAWIVQARKRVSAAREAWSAVAGADMHRVSTLNETFSLVGDSLRRLYPAGDELAQALSGVAAQTVQSGQSPAAPLAMEVATSVLYLEASLEDVELDHPELEQRVKRLAQRVQDVRRGAEPLPLDTWMEELYRRVSDHQTMGSVVQELRASLSEVEKEIDQYFRDPAKRDVLYPVPAQLSSMRGVLSVLGLDQASAAVLRMRDDVDALAQTEVDAHQAIGAGTFDRLAENLGALSFLIDMLSVQPQLAKSLFTFDPATGNLRAVMGQAERTPAFADSNSAPGPDLADRAEQLARAAAGNEVSDDVLASQFGRLAQQAMLAEERSLADAMSSAQAALKQTADEGERRALRADLAQTMQALAAPFAPPPLPAAAPLPAPGDDSEMREVFIEEAREVMQEARQALERLIAADRDSGADLGEMTAVRRAFHTLKGSARMVGLGEFGEAGWACEQLYNARLAQNAAMDVPLLGVTRQALDYMGEWVDAIADGRDDGHRPAPVVNAADALRTAGRVEAIEKPGAQPSIPAEPAPASVDAPPVPAPAAAADDAVEARLPEVVSTDLEPVSEVPELRELADAVPDLPAAEELDLGTFELPDLDVTATRPDGDVRRHVEAPPAPEFALDFGDLDSVAPTPVAPPPPPVHEPEPADIGMMATVPWLPMPAEGLRDEAPAPTIETIELDMSAFDEATAASDGADAAPSAFDSLPMPFEEEQVKVIGPLRIELAMFNIFLNEADELSRRLSIELAEWSTALSGPPGEDAVVLAHSLAGSSATVGFADLSTLARALEHALMRSNETNGLSPGEPDLYNEAADEIRRLLHQFAAGFLKSVTPGLVERLDDHQPEPMPAGSDVSDRDALPDLPDFKEDDTSVSFAESSGGSLGGDVPAPSLLAASDRGAAHDLDAAFAGADDSIDPDLFPIFAEEAEELLPQLHSRMREWAHRAADPGAAAACMRTLHTFKGGARLAGAMRLGERAHRLETSIEHLLADADIKPADVDPLVAQVDAIENDFTALRAALAAAAQQPAPAPEAAPVVAPEPMPVQALVSEPVEPSSPPVVEIAQEPAGVDLDDVPDGPCAEEPALAADDLADVATSLPLAAPPVDWSRFTAFDASLPVEAQERAPAVSTAAVRVRAALLDRMVNQAGEVSIARARMESDVGQLKSSLSDLTDNLDRMRSQLRDIEVQAESQISSRMEAAKAASAEFDPLEMDRFTRFQELTRMLAESVNDVATVQRSLQRTLQSTEDQLADQARLTRSLQDDLLRTRMIEFEALSERLYRVVRQAAKETQRQVKLDIVGGSIEIDRGVLDRMTAPFEHLLRNCVTHGIEAPAARVAAGKESTGAITIALHQEGNEVAVEFRDDGAGLNLERIRERAVAAGLLAADAAPSDAELADFIFTPGFSTAHSVTELAGRGVGMDIVRSEVVAMGGRIETDSTPGHGTRFRLVLPLTTAVTQVVLLRCGDVTVAVPSTLVEVVRRVRVDEVEQAYAAGTWMLGDVAVPFHWLGALLDREPRGAVAGRTVPVVVIRSAAQRVALHVDEIVGNQEVVVKNLGPQLARLPGLAGMTLLPSGAVSPIYNPVALAALYGDAARARLRAPAADTVVPVAVEPEAPAAPLILVVDDSLTVRRVTQRLLVREGYRVTTAKDGMDALERLAEEKPAVVLSDIEMPRMDGFDLVRNLRADARLADLPVIMITSRIAQKHRDYANELGVNHYLGKPYGEEELLSLVARHARRMSAPAPL